MAACANFPCAEPGTLVCTRCQAASPQMKYCSEDCKLEDWQWHRQYCGKKSYTFELTLVGSSNPVIKRVFDIPSWWTFRQLHYTIQYAMGPWNQSHLHNFTFQSVSINRPIQPFSLVRQNQVLQILPLKELQQEVVHLPGYPIPVVPKEAEETLLLSDVYGPEGWLRDLVIQDGESLPLIYTYDFGDNWRHQLDFKGSKLARANQPLFSFATGRGPVEDCGGTVGWERVKAAFHAFRAMSGSEPQHRLVAWARGVSGLGEAFDPFMEPDIVEMNYEGPWERHLVSYAGDFGDNEEDPEYSFS